ncbi:ATP-binding cassette domain-containing protein [Clostridium sp. OS1-26]|uniref:ATP-binding cassette domain-containing protein n=1 Tax=Clostridium sp. OS1-26 TaxID=3070681 RepID=UPI0027DECD10|nr:ATP-binding cassette domain-containing protein [Clostridium sp. OS1-26]WML34248.1 ATP-binding cassette domain-containing protein [Clostridium sp. OS1-26]
MKISIENLDITYAKNKKVLHDVSVEIEGPGIIGVLGPTGAGKTTFIKLLIGELSPTSGQILVDDVPLPKMKKRLKESLGYLPQSFGLYDELTLWQFLDYIAALKGIENSRKIIKEVIKKTNLTDKQEAAISTLSSGERQRIGIAQALMGSPELLIFDEPTATLDLEECINFRNLLSQTAQDKIVLLSTNIIEDVQLACDQLIVIKYGQILFNGTPEQLIASAYNHAEKPTLEEAYMYLIKGKEGIEQ